MPHPCLQCGHMVPEDASSQLLQGCPTCKGTRFFYTSVRVDDDARQQIAQKAQKDLRQVVAQLLEEADPDGVGAQDWHELRPRDLRRLVKKVQEQESAAPAWENPDVKPVGVDVRGAMEKVAAALADAQAAAKERPETVEAGDGHYDIDVRGLLERNPIVVHKDGAYLIHLPSLFDRAPAD